MEQRVSQSKIDEENALFWDEPCGSLYAKSAGLTGQSLKEFQAFDSWFFDFYPYLKKHIPFSSLEGKRVLEVGLGYGSVTQRLAENGAEVTALDIAKGPVELVRRRFELSNLRGNFHQGNILKAPFPDESFDFIVSIGCLHHTGDAAKGISEVLRLLKPGGSATLMVYNALSYRRWILEPLNTLNGFIRSFWKKGVSVNATCTERQKYDANTSGEAAPETAFFSSRDVRFLCKNFKSVRVYGENVDSYFYGIPLPRLWLLKNLGHLSGLDLYIHLEK